MKRMSMRVNFAGLEVDLLPELAACIPSLGLLVLSDLHLGKGDHFTVHGAPIAARVNMALLQESMSRVRAAVLRTGVSRLVVVGDLIHAPTGLVEPVVQGLRQLREELARLGCTMVLVRGNHDRGLELPAGCEIEIVPRLECGGVVCVHDPAEAEPGQATICGHLHPAVAVGMGRGAPRVPVFWVREHLFVLPAFGKFTGGVAPVIRSGDRVFAAAEGAVVQIPVRAVQPCPAT